MRVIVITLSAISAIIGLALSILPFGFIALIPIIASFIFGLIAFKLQKNEGKKTGIIKIIFTIIIVSLGLTLYNTLKPNEINVDNQTIEKQKKEDQETLDQLEDINIDE